MRIIDQILPKQGRGKKSTKQLRVLGFDLGTTNSTVAEIVYSAAGKGDVQIRCLPVEQGTEGRSWWNPLVPSIVALHNGQEIVGEGARRLRSRGRESGLIEQGSIFAQITKVLKMNSG